MAGLYVFSSSTSLPTQEPIDKFGYLVKFRFNGDCSAAARWIVGKYPKFFQYDNDFQSIQPTSASLATASQVSAKSQSNFSQTEIMSRRISEEVVVFIDSDPAPFKNKDLYSELYVNSQAERKAVRNALLYQEKIGKISRIEGERGSWEVVEDTPEKMNLLSTDTKPFNLLLPLGISEHVVVRPGAVVLVAGASNAGKTAFLLRTVRNHLAEFLKSPHMQTPSDPPFINKREGGLPEIRYLNSEMSANELVARIECFGDEPAQWNKYDAENHSVIESN